jgi:hypothetical protein
MTRLVSARSLRAALFAAATLGATTLATAPAAEAHHFHGLGLSIGLGSGYGYSGVYLAPRCGWLYRKAVRTGDAYWWDRYEACRYGY